MVSEEVDETSSSTTISVAKLSQPEYTMFSDKT